MADPKRKYTFSSFSDLSGSGSGYSVSIDLYDGTGAYTYPVNRQSATASFSSGTSDPWRSGDTLKYIKIYKSNGGSFGYKSTDNVTIKSTPDVSHQINLYAGSISSSNRIGYCTLNNAVTEKTFTIERSSLITASTSQIIVEVYWWLEGLGNTNWVVEVGLNHSATLTWSNPTLSLSQSTTSRQVTATMGGTATHSDGDTVTYYLYESGTQVGQFSNGTLTFTPSAGSHTYKTVAKAGGLTADGTTASITVVEPAITWSSASLTLVQSQSSLQVTATMGGTATHSRGLSVTYYLYEGSTQIGTFSNGTLTFTSTVGNHTYKTVAAAGGLTADGATTSITVNGPTLTWSDAYLFLVQTPNTSTVTAMMGGTATHSFGETVTYYLYEGTTQIGTFTSSNLSFTATAGEHTYKTVAAAGGLTADGAITSISVVDSITWSNPTLTLAQVQNTLNVTATMGGTATHSSGASVTYYLYEGSTQIGTFSNNSLTFTSTAGSHTYKTVATAGGLSADGASASITVADQDRETVGRYNGSSWDACEVFRYDGTEFVQMKPYYYDGTEFVPLQK